MANYKLHLAATVFFILTLISACGKKEKLEIYTLNVNYKYNPQFPNECIKYYVVKNFSYTNESVDSTIKLLDSIGSQCPPSCYDYHFFVYLWKAGVVDTTIKFDDDYRVDEVTYESLLVHSQWREGRLMGHFMLKDGTEYKRISGND
jgi:hypothetical protein